MGSDWLGVGVCANIDPIRRELLNPKPLGIFIRAPDLSLLLDVAAKVWKVEGGRAKVNNHLFSICLPTLTQLPTYKITLLCSGG